MKRHWIAPILAALSTAWCVVMGFIIWFTPIRYSGTVGGSGGPDHQVVTSHAFSEMSRLGVVPLLIPVIIAALATRAAWRGSRMGLGGLALLFAAFTVITGFSIGGAYLPAALLLIVAAIVLAVVKATTRQDEPTT